MQVLAVGAHPDDIELGCGASLALFKRKGHNVNLLVLTNGEGSGNPSISENQCESSAKILGADNLLFGNLKDTRITDGIESIMTIENALNQIAPELVFAHSPRDRHQDHRNAGLATMSAARDTKRILLYESPSALREFNPQVFIDVGETFAVKMEALKAFGSRTSRIYHGSHRDDDQTESRKFPHVLNAIEGLARFRGFQAGIEMSEAFEVGKFLLEIQDNHGH